MKLLTNIETAELLGVKSTTLDCWRHYGKGPRFRKLGTGKQAPIRYAESDVLAWLDQGTFASTSAYSPNAVATLTPHNCQPAKASG